MSSNCNYRPKYPLYRPCFLRNGKSKNMFPWQFNQQQLMKGIHVELEHTSDIYTAMLIACDHLAEHPYYYDLLEKVEKHTVN